MWRDSDGSTIDITRAIEVLREIAGQACLKGHPRGMKCNELPGYDRRLWCVTCKARVALETS